jgi:hypothetical protein
MLATDADVASAAPSSASNKSENDMKQRELKEKISATN